MSERQALPMGRHDERCYCVDCIADRLGFMERPKATRASGGVTLLSTLPEPRHYQRALDSQRVSIGPLVAAIACASFMLGVWLGWLMRH